MTDDLIDIYSSCKKIMPFVHLPIQSGSDRILKLMNRNHTTDHYYSIFKKLKQINSNIQFSSDFIIGYPGETEKDFKDTLNLINKIKFINSYSFIFSPRPGTVASKLENVKSETAKERLLEIQSVLFNYQLKFNENLIGKSIDVLVENHMKDDHKLFGRNIFLNPVIFNGETKEIGKIVKIKIKKVNQLTLFGDIVVKNKMRAA